MDGSESKDDIIRNGPIENTVLLDEVINQPYRSDDPDVDIFRSVDYPQSDQNISRSYVICENSGFTGETEDKVDTKCVDTEEKMCNSVEETGENNDSQLPFAHLEEFDGNISKSYIISEPHIFDDGHDFRMESNIADENDMKKDKFDFDSTSRMYEDLPLDIREGDVSKSYTVTENNRSPLLEEFGPLNAGMEENEHNRLIIDEIVENDKSKRTCESFHSPALIENNNSSNNEQCPPTDSLKSIKSIAEKRKKKMLESYEIEERGVGERGESAKETIRNNVTGNNRYKPKSASLMPKPFLRKNEGRLSSKSMNKNIPVKTCFKRDQAMKTPTKIVKNDSVKKSPLGKKNTQVEIQQLHLLNEKEKKKSLRICQNLMSSQKKWNLEKEKMCTEYESTIEDLKGKVSALKKEGNDLGSNIGANPNVRSEDKFENLQKQFDLQESLLKGLQEENERLYNDIKQRDELKQENEHKIRNEKQELLQQIETLKMNHQVEYEKVQKKLKWYSENQLLLDRDEVELKNKREEIKDLRTIVERLEAEIRKIKHENTELKKELSSRPEPVKIAEDTCVTKEVNTDSKSTICILPSTEKKEEESVMEQKEVAVNDYLERYIKTLEKELEEKDADNAKKIRAIEQKYTILNLEYEENVQQLKTKLDELTLENDSEKSDKSIEAVIASLNRDHNIAMSDLQNKLAETEEELAAKKFEYDEESKNKNENVLKTNTTLQKKVDRLREKVKTKDGQINELASTVLQLRNERVLLTEELQNNLEERKLNFLPDQTQPKKDRCRGEANNFNDLHATLLDSNKDLKKKMEELKLLCKEKQLRYEALELKSQSEIGNLIEKGNDERNSIAQKHEVEIEKLKMQFVVNHSSSKVAELNGKIQGHEQMIEQLKYNLEDARADQYKLKELKLSEESLLKKISQLQQELVDARKLDTPELHHYRMLEAKINCMEKNHHSREEKLEEIVEKTKAKANMDAGVIEERCREELRKKDDEIQKFRIELDNIIEVLQELQRQGLEIPNFDVEIPR